MKDLILEDQFFDSVLFEIPESKEIILPEGSTYRITVIADVDSLSNEANGDLLSNIITALGYNYGKDTNLLSVELRQSLKLSSIKALECPRILIFGDQSKLLTSQMQLQLNTLAIFGHQEWVCSFPLNEFAEDKNKKMQLWKSIQHWKQT